MLPPLRSPSTQTPRWPTSQVSVQAPFHPSRRTCDRTVSARRRERGGFDARHGPGAIRDRTRSSKHNHVTASGSKRGWCGQAAGATYGIPLDDLSALMNSSPTKSVR